MNLVDDFNFYKFITQRFYFISRRTKVNKKAPGKGRSPFQDIKEGPQDPISFIFSFMNTNLGTGGGLACLVYLFKAVFQSDMFSTKL